MVSCNFISWAVRLSSLQLGAATTVRAKGKRKFCTTWSLRICEMILGEDQLVYSISVLLQLQEPCVPLKITTAAQKVSVHLLKTRIQNGWNLLVIFRCLAYYSLDKQAWGPAEVIAFSPLSRGTIHQSAWTTASYNSQREIRVSITRLGSLILFRKCPRLTFP